MKRRNFMALISGAAFLAPRRGFAQETGRTYRLGVISLGPHRTSSQGNIFDELRRRGFVEGQNLIVDGRGYEARVEQLPVVATGLAQAEIEAIRCIGPAQLAPPRCEAPHSHYGASS